MKEEKSGETEQIIEYTHAKHFSSSLKRGGSRAFAARHGMGTIETGWKVHE